MLREIIRDQIAVLTAMEQALREHHQDFGHEVDYCPTCSFLSIQIDTLRKRARRYQV